MTDYRERCRRAVAAAVPGRWSDPGRSLSGQSTTIAVVLVLAISLGGTTTVLVIGSGAFTDAQQQVSNERAETVLSQMDSKIATVAIGPSTSQTVQLPTTQDRQYRIDESAGRINVTLFPGSGGKTVIVDRNLGEIRYGSGQTTLAYQGGGVWRKVGNGSTMVSPPEFQYRGLTLTLPLIRIDDQGAIGDSVTISENETGIEKFPTGNTGNPLGDATVKLKLTSEYYQAWESFFEERTEGNATVHHSNDTVVLEFATQTSSNQFQPAAGVVSRASSKTIVLDNKACVDSYNSSTDPAWSGNWETCNNNINNKSIVTHGNIKINSGTKLWGNVTAGGTVKLPGGQIKGNVFCADDNANCVTKENKVSKEVINTNNEVPDPSPVTDTIDQKKQSLDSSSENDNDAEDDISGNRIDRDSGTEEITAGEYYLTKIDRDSDVILDTSNGDITLVVDGKWDLDGARITVQGKNVVRIYIPDTGSDEMVFDNQARLFVRHGGDRSYNSSQVWVYGTPGFVFDINTESQFTGVIYAPEGKASEAGEVDIQSSAIFGAVVAHVKKMDQGNKQAVIHYDTSLGTEAAGQAADPGSLNIENMHVTVNRVNVTG